VRHWEKDSVMPLATETDVVIVGAGPTGLALAISLALRGVRFVLLDKLRAPQPNSRAAAIHARTLEVLEPLGVTETLRQAGREISTAIIRDRDTALLRVDFGQLHSRYRYILLLPQNKTEALLTDRMSGIGGSVERGREVTAVTQNGETVTAMVTDAEGATTRIAARYIVGADGFHSVVRREAGIPFDHGTYAEAFILADVHMEWPLGADELGLFLAQDGMMLVAPFSDGRYRVVATMADPPEHPTAADVQAILDKRGPSGSIQVRDLVWSSRFRIHHGVAAHYRGGRAFLAGDAAHVHSPAGGQGMNTGIQDAVLLGERLASVLAGRQPDSFLDGYETERRPVAQQVVRMTDQMTRMATLTGIVGQLRNLGLRTVDHLPAVKRMIATRMAELTG
jgi:2-polyprenyl-6-methoxyphenol hydroxylase-like FAD-dependent oxidoreductase